MTEKEDHRCPPFIFISKRKRKKKKTEGKTISHFIFYQNWAVDK